MILLTFLVPVVIIGLVIWFIYRFKTYNYIGNVYIYIVSAYLMCLVLSLFVNLNPIHVNSTEVLIINGVPTEISSSTTNVSGDNAFSAIAVSIFDALRMMAIAFDKSVIAPYSHQVGEYAAWYKAFAIVYNAASLVALLSTSIGVILFFSKSFFAKLRNFFKSLNPKREVYFIFSDFEVAGPAKKLASALKKDKHIVIMYVTKASLKTQDGTEYRDALINEKLDVKSESFSRKVCKFLFDKYFNRHFKRFLFFPWPYHNRKVTVYGLFSTDDSSIELASNFKEEIRQNKYFKKYYLENQKANVGQLELFKYLDNFRVFVTCQEYDIDVPYDFSGQTKHIINTLSQYDMVSSEFVLKNQLVDFISVKDGDRTVVKVDDTNKDAFHISFFGFGNINRPIFDKMTYAYQLWDDKDHKMHYHVYDYHADEIVAGLENEYVNEVKQEKGGFEKPLLYYLDANCNGEDLTSYEMLCEHFAEIKNDPNRFNPNGFEVFVVSAATTNTDINIASNLRKVLYRIFSNDLKRLSRTFIFVRIGNETIAESFKAVGKDYVFEQDNFNKFNLNTLPIVIFGQNTNMAEFIDKDYEILTRLGQVANTSYSDEPVSEEEAIASWLSLKKIGVLDNIASAYSLKTKLAILDMNLTDYWVIQDKNSGQPLDKENYQSALNKQKEAAGAYPPEGEKKNTPMMKLAGLEHNRWLATSFLNHKYGQLSFEEHLEVNLKNNKRRGKTKDPNETKHVCMVTNDGLRELRAKLISKDAFKGTGVEPLDVKDVDKLVYDNDIIMMNNIFEELVSIHQDLGKK